MFHGKIDALRDMKSGILGQVGDQGYDPCLFLDTHIGVLMKEKQGYSDAVDGLISVLPFEHENVLGCVKELQEQRNQLNQEIRAKTAGPVLQSLKETS